MTQTWQKTLRIVQLNAENLFLFFDQPLPTQFNEIKALTEKQWQNLSQATTNNKSLSKTVWLSEALKDLNPDFILMNEVGGPESLANFSRYFLEDAFEPFIVEGNSDRGIDVGYLVKRTLPIRCELMSHKNRPLNFLYPHEIESPKTTIKSHYFSRDCAELRVFRQGEETPALVFLLVHLKSKLDPDGIDPEGRERRAAELKTLMNIYKEVRQKFNVPIIVGGDFNGNARSDSKSPEFAELKNVDLLNPLEVMALPMDQAATQIQFQRSGHHQFLQIDYVLISEDLKSHLVTTESGVYRYKSDLKVTLPLPTTLDQRLQMPSDHYPVYLTLRNFLM